jgi:hypothetical protein
MGDGSRQYTQTKAPLTDKRIHRMKKKKNPQNAFPMK